MSELAADWRADLPQGVVALPTAAAQPVPRPHMWPPSADLVDELKVKRAERRRQANHPAPVVPLPRPIVEDNEAKVLHNTRAGRLWEGETKDQPAEVLIYGYPDDERDMRTQRFIDQFQQLRERFEGLTTKKMHDD